MSAPKKSAGIAAPRLKLRRKRPGRHNKKLCRKSQFMGPRAA
jgi:hypothetical protein